MSDFAAAREEMIARQVVARGIRWPRLIEALRRVPREAFVAPELAPRAYEDGPLPIGEEQTISQPFIVAAMIAAAAPEPYGRVLEVGAGCGYASAVLSRVAARVFAIERHATLAVEAAERLDALGFDNVTIRAGDGALGWPEEAPFDAIIVSAGGPRVPQPLLDQLRDGGRLVIPVGREGDQRLLKITREGDRFDEEDLGPVRFVPLIGDY